MERLTLPEVIFYFSRSKARVWLLFRLLFCGCLFVCLIEKIFLSLSLSFSLSLSLSLSLFRCLSVSLSHCLTVSFLLFLYVSLIFALLPILTLYKGSLRHRRRSAHRRHALRLSHGRTEIHHAQRRIGNHLAKAMGFRRHAGRLAN